VTKIRNEWQKQEMSDKNKKWAIKMQCRYFCPFCPFCQFAENFINPQKATLLS